MKTQSIRLGLALSIPVLAIFLAPALSTNSLFAQESAAATNISPNDQSVKVVAAADALLKSLTDAQRTAVLFRFSDEEQRVRWSNLPTGIFDRKGLRMGDLTPEHRDAVMAVLRNTLSDAGYQQVVDNMEGEELLKGDGRGRLVFGKDEYYFSILGTPSLTEAWMWQFGGHHLAINATVIRDRITLAPSLTGGQPMRYTRNGQPVVQMAEEIAVASELVSSLDATQKSKAVLSDRFSNMLLGPGKEDVVPKPEGIRGADLSDTQKSLLKQLISLRIGLLNDEDALARQTEAEEKLDDTRFLWHGPTAPGSAAYYRVQGPVIFFEYSPQQMGGNPSDHIHAMYREFGNDYGLQWFRKN